MPASRSRAWFPGVALVLATAVPWVFAEGVHSLLGGASAQPSLAASLLSNLKRKPPAPVASPHDPASQMIVRESDIKALLPAMKASGVGLGNSPYSELKTEEASVNTEKGPCLEQRPNLRKKVAYLRTNLFNPFDQMSFFVDADRELPTDLKAFVDRYAFRFVSHTTNEFGERNTLPKSVAQHVVLVAGDSVANGLAIDDSETLSSQLQARDPSRRYVNLGIARAAAADITCALERAADRYHGRIDEVIYVLCENDFDQGGKWSTPDEITQWLDQYRRRENIGHMTLIVSPLIYNTIPEVMRVRGHSHYEWPTFLDQRTQVMALARDKGINVIDFVDITAAERERGLSQFAPLALYVDHAHWSPLGVSRVVAALTAQTSAQAEKAAYAEQAAQQASPVQDAHPAAPATAPR